MNALRGILLVEDDDRDVELTLEALSQHKLTNTVEVVRDGVEALDYLRYKGSFAMRSRSNPVVVLLDLKMPRVDGIEVLKEMRADPQLKTIPVVILTSSRESKDLKKCYQEGANAYVVKPVKFEDFVAAIKESGMFWAILNEPPPGSMIKSKKEPSP